MTRLTLHVCLRLCRKTRSGFERPFFHLAESGFIDDKTDIACFAVLARRKHCSPSGRRWSFPIEPNPAFTMPFLPNPYSKRIVATFMVLTVSPEKRHLKGKQFRGLC